MAGYRKGRIDEQMRCDLSEIVRTVKDPRVSTAFISIMGVDCSADLKFAKIFVSVMREKRSGDAIKGLTNAAGYIRTQLAARMNLRITPELTFVNDETAKHSQRINDLLKQVESDLIDDDDDDDGEGEKESGEVDE